MGHASNIHWYPRKPGPTSVCDRRRVDGPVSRRGHLSCSQLGRRLRLPALRFAELFWQPSRRGSERLLQAVSCRWQAWPASGPLLFPAPVLSQPREPLGEALPERVAEMRASHQQNLLSQNRARVLGCDFCPPAVCAASFPRASQGWSQLKRPTSRQTSCLNFGYGKCGHSHIGGKSIGFGSCLIAAGLRKNKVVAMKLPTAT